MREKLKNIEDFKISENVFPIRIATPFAVGDVYAYLIVDEKIVLVDTGHKSNESWERLTKSLKKRGISLNDIDEIWLTHGHPDHFGQAGQIAEISDLTILGHRKERANFGCNNDRDLFADLFDKHHLPSHFIKKMINQLDWLHQYQVPVKPTWIKDGETLTSGTMDFTVMHVPGHAPGHLLFREKNGFMFGGDLLLEHISTNALINFDPDTDQRNKSLLQYRQSLKRVLSEDGLVFPGHGKLIKNAGKTAEKYLIEQRYRLNKIIGILEKKPYSLFDIARHMFDEAIDRGEIFLVLSELLGFLDWGEHEGAITKEVVSGRIHYRAAEK